MRTPNPTRPLTRFGSSLFLALFALGCGIERPAVTNRSRMLASFNHAGFENSCTTCHEQHRPTPVGGVAHGNGGDCVTCHSTVTWIGAKGFSHAPIPVSCTSCHENSRPTDSVWPETPTVRAGHFTGNDCASCHTTPVANARWLFDHKSASGDIGTCIPCHENKGRDKHRNQPDYFNNGGRCAECHKRSRGWSPL